MTTEEYAELVPLGGSVFAGVHAATGQAWALKVLPERLDRRTRNEIEAEMRRLAQAAGDAPIVVADRIVTLPDGRAAMRRELLAQSLPELIEAFGPLSVPDTIALGSALAEALTRGVHGGLTPGNVLFRASGEPVLTDFGVTLRQAFPSDDPAFRAPETLRDGVLDSRSDLYGLGAVLYYALSGRPPFTDDAAVGVLTEPPPPIGRDDLPPGLSALVSELLAKDPGQRPADVAARLAQPAQPSARAVGTPIIEFGPERRRRRPGPPVLAAAAVAALLAVVAVLLVLSRPRDMVTPPVAQPPPVSNAPAEQRVLIELADPVDRGNFVELSWTSAATLYFGVSIAPDGGPTDTKEVGKATSFRVEVDPVKKYCFEIRGANDQGTFLSQPKPIRGAVCVRRSA